MPAITAMTIFTRLSKFAALLAVIAFCVSLPAEAARHSRAPLPEMALYRLYRGVDARDVAAAFSLALNAPLGAFEVFNLSGKTPFLESDCDQLMQDAPAVLSQRCPELVETYRRLGWPLPCSIDRVYATEKARLQLGWQPQFDWQQLLHSAGFSFNHLD